MLFLQAYPLLAIFVAGGLATQFTAEKHAYFKAHNIKTRVTDLTPLDRYLHELNYPQINLTEISAQQGSQYNYSVKSGIATSNLIDIPQLMLLLKSTGKDEISLPNYRYETGFYFCYLGYCSGYRDIYRITNAKLHNLVPATANGGVTNGTTFWLNYNGGHAEVRCPQCTYDHTDLRQNPPVDSDRYLKRNLTMIASNITVLTTFEMKKDTTGLEMENLEITLTVGEYGLRYQNVTHTAPGGSQEELGEEVNNYSFFLSQWEEYYEEIVELLQTTFNCFLSDGRSGDNDICELYYNPFVHMSMGQIFHGLGLVAISNEQPDNSSMSTCVADVFHNGQASDEIDLINKILFKYATQALMTGRWIGEYLETLTQPPDYPFAIPFQAQFTCIKENCTNDGSRCDLIQDEILVGTDDPSDENAATVYGADSNAAVVKFTPNTFTYSYTSQNFRFVAGDFARVITNLNTTARDHFNGLELAVIDSTIQFRSNFDFVQGKFVVSNFEVDLFLGDVFLNVSEVLHYENEEWFEMPPIDKHVSETVMQLWNQKDETGRSLSQRYSSLMEHNINLLLARLPLP